MRFPGSIKESEGEAPAAPKAQSSEYGLKVLHGVEDATVESIIFVHGLTGHREKTWTAKGAERPWPQTLLPQKLPSARIMTFGYDANFIDWKSAVSQNRVSDHAEGLLSTVANFRCSDNTNDRYILFVAHSLGGLVCEDALLMSRNSSIEYRQKIIDCTRGIAFLGTPHAGSDLSKWARWVTRVPVPLISMNRKILEPLNRTSGTLGRIEDDFCQMLARINKDERRTDVASFYETLEIRGVGMVVPRESAKLSQYANTPIRANHEGMTKFNSLQDDGFLSVSGQLHRWVQEFRHLPGCISTVPYPQNPSFVGRKDILHKIREFFDKELHHKLAIYGLGGIGKSQILLEYAYKHKRSASRGPVFWVSAVSRSRFQDHYREIAQKLNILTKDNNREMDVLRLVKDALEKKESGEWLMIIDNADEMSVLYDTDSDLEKSLFNYIPGNPNGSILYSTRSRANAQKLAGEILKIGELSTEESQELLRRNMSDITVTPVVEEEWPELLDELAHLPLAIVQAASYMKMQGWNAATYLALFRKDMRRTMLTHEVQVLGSEESSSQSDHLEERSKTAALRTFVITFRQIQDQDPRAAEILCLMACYNWQNVPFELVRDAEIGKCVTSSMQDAEIPGPFAASIGTLTAFSLVTTTLDHRNYTIHRMVKFSMLEWLKYQPGRQTWIDKALASLVNLYSSPNYPDTLKSGRLVPHIEPVLNLYPRWSEVSQSPCVVFYLEIMEPVQDRYILPRSHISGFCRLLCSCAEHLMTEGQYGLAEKYTLIARSLFDTYLAGPEPWRRSANTPPSEDDKLGCLAMFLLGQLALANGRTMLAIWFARQAWSSYRETMGTRNGETVPMCLVTGSRADWDEFAPLAGLADVALHEQLLLVEMMNLQASASLASGCLQPAEDLSTFIDSWSQDRNILPPFTTATNIALVKLNRGLYEDAETSLSGLVSRAIEQFGLRSLESLQTKTYLATAQYCQGRWEAARALNQEVLEMREATFNPSHPRTIENRNLSALILFGQGEYLEARKCLEALLGFSDKSLGVKHAMTITLVNNLAVVLYSMYEYEAAEQYLKRAFEDSSKLGGQHHLRTKNIRVNLHHTLFCEGKTGYDWVQRKDLLREVPVDGLDDWIKRKEASVYRSWTLVEYDAEAFERVVKESSWYRLLQKEHDKLSSMRTAARKKKKRTFTLKLPKLQKMLAKGSRRDSGILEPPLDLGSTRIKPDPYLWRLNWLRPIGFDKIHSLAPFDKMKDVRYPAARVVLGPTQGQIDHFV
ncbi:hypothetical protein MMC18_003891 [Xylographa bjoerkii]|nr:hypothetical protein [Xylographa bjoerkii]